MAKIFKAEVTMGWEALDNDGLHRAMGIIIRNWRESRLKEEGRSPELDAIAMNELVTCFQVLDRRLSDQANPSPLPDDWAAPRRPYRDPPPKRDA